MAKSPPPYRLKMARAKRHLAELGEEVKTFLACNPYELYSEKHEAAGQRHVKVRFNADIPSEWSAIIGDVIHNARSALDLLMVEVVKFCDHNRASYNHVYFVIRESEEAFERALPRCIQGASPEARRIIEELKPYKDGNDALYQLHQLDILDKHKAIIPVGAAHRNLIIDMAEGFRQSFPEEHALMPPMFVALRPANRQFPLRDGATVFVTGLDDRLHDDIKITIEIAFGEGQILDGEAINPALNQLCQSVEETFNAFETGLPGFSV